MHSDQHVAVPELESFASSLVGRYFIEPIQCAVKRAMLQEALRRTGANYSQAAGLLGVKRQAVQQMVTRLGLKAWAAEMRQNGAARVPNRLRTLDSGH